MNDLARQWGETLPGAVDDEQPDWLTGLRNEGAIQFRRLGLPGKRDERWKYTPVFSLEQQQPALGVAVTAREAVTASAPLADLPVRITMMDGMLAGIKGELPAGSHVGDLATVVREDDTRLEQVLGSLSMDEPGSGFSALNTAVLGNGLVISVNPGVDAGEVLLQWNHATEKALCNARVVILLGEGARLNLVEQFESVSGAAVYSNLVFQCELAAESWLGLTRVQQLPKDSFLVTRTDAGQLADSRLQLTCLDLGDGLARHDVTTKLAAPGASCALSGACMTAGNSHVDHHLEALHAAPDCRSEQLFRAVANDRSRVVFNGKVHVQKGADGTDATQSSAGLLLSKLAEIDAKPELEIYADEVIASHGATVGQLDEEALFYLRSRGLSPARARNLLTLAFCRSVTDQIPVRALREPLGRRLAERLESHG